ncbi:DUF2913 family protein [Pseudomonadota bacterium]
MSKEKYHQLLSDVIENSLLHLYGQVASNDRFVPLARRNDIVCKFLKPKLKQPCYKSIKGDIKRMILVGQRKGGDLEAKLNELHSMSVDYQKKANDAQKLFDLLSILLSEHGFDSKIFDESAQAEPEVIYVLQDHLENCFEDNGTQIAPVSMLIESDHSLELIEFINATQLFSAELKESDSNNQQSHILLHPVK